MKFARDQVRDHISSFHSIDIKLTTGDEAYFCFLGEFGYEVVSWIPYLLYLKKELGIRINTISRPDSSVFYYFSDNHTEVDPSLLTYGWGDAHNYKRVQRTLENSTLIFPASNYSEKRRIVVNGIEWFNRDIHKPIDESHYIRPDYSSVRTDLPFSFSRYAVINNKFVKEWEGAPINYFDRQALIRLRDTLLDAGVHPVYNRFVEKTAVDEDLLLDDEDIFRKEGCYDMRDFYDNLPVNFSKNTVQVSMFNEAAFVIGVQGGNVYIPAVCRKHIYMLMRKGKYIDYQELARIFSAQIDVFYEPDHLAGWVRERLDKEV